MSKLRYLKNRFTRQAPKLVMTDLPYVSFAIFPGINVARLGNAEEFYVGPEIPGVYVGKGNPDFEFKKDGKIKPQAARFRIYGYDINGMNLGEIDLSDDKFKGNVKVEIEWTVVLANKKAAHKIFTGIDNPSDELRNPDWPYDRSTLMAIEEHSLKYNGVGQPPPAEEFKPRVYRTDNDNDGKQLHLGKMIMEKEGSLLIIGGKGESGSIKDTLITQYANNDYWYDDTSDGSIDAKVTIIKYENNKTTRTQLFNREGKSWVLVAPPKFAPGIRSVVPLYQVILETQHPVDPVYPAHDPVNYLNSDTIEERSEKMKVNYYRDIYPIFEAICRNSWVNKMGFMGHGSDKPGNFLSPDLETKLSTPPSDGCDKYKDMRISVLSRVRIPPKFATTFERDGQPYDYFMPPLSGDDGDVIPSYPNTYLTVTPGQYVLLQKWANGEFTKGRKPPEYKYCFDDRSKQRQPTYGDGEKVFNFQGMVDQILGKASKGDKLVVQAQFLNKAVLEWCVGGAFFPGIEMTYLAYDKNTFDKTYDFRINSDNFQPGDINAYMALPWQADYNECSTHWWPAQRPDIVIPYDDKVNEERGIQLGDFVEWTRGFRNDEPNRGEPKWGDMDMVDNWYKLGFVIEKENILGVDKAFVEFEREDIYGVEIKDYKPQTLDELYDLLKIALQFELSTIPPYLYAMYSIKQGLDEITIGDIIRKKILRVAAEEMLHVSLVANLMTAIGRKPVFYSPEMIPFYPNPLPHFEEGQVLVHLSKADVKAFENFVRIEKPITSGPQERESLHLATDIIAVADVNFDSVAELYKKIREFFANVGIDYQTTFQLGPGMGYAPSTGADNEKGLIIVEDSQSATDAIDLIVKQGEGGYDPQLEQIGNISFKGVFDGETKATITKSTKRFEISIQGKINGTISNETKTIVGTIENGTVIGSIKPGLVVEGTIEGIFKGNIVKETYKKTVEQIITGTFVSKNVFGENKEKAPSGDNTNEAFVAIQIKTSLNGTIHNAGLYENSHFNIFRMCKMYIENAPDYHLWPVIEDPYVSPTAYYSTTTDYSTAYYNDPNRSYNDSNIIDTATAFNAAYSYLMLLLQNAWRVDGQDKKILIIGGMPALMHGVLKPIAKFLAETSISSDTNAGATFGYYEFTNKSSVKSQLIAAVQKASKAFPDRDELKTAAKVVDSLPDISLTI